MRKTKPVHCVFFLIMLLISACQSNTNLVSKTEIPTIAVKTFVPAKGTAILSGRILSDKDNTPLIDTPVRLAQVYRQGEEGAFVLDLSHSPSALTDKNGNFDIVDIPPAEYLLVIGKPDEDNYVIYHDAENKPITYQISADKVVKVGNITISYSP